jgi:hypothetical protein
LGRRQLLRQLRSRDIGPALRESRPEALNRKRPKEKYLMDKNIETTATVEGMRDYNNKVIEFARANTNAAFDVLQKMSDVKSSSVFVELWAEHVRKQVETLTEQSKQLAALAQKVTFATADPLKT